MSSNNFPVHSSPQRRRQRRHMSSRRDSHSCLGYSGPVDLNTGETVVTSPHDVKLLMNQEDQMKDTSTPMAGLPTARLAFRVASTQLESEWLTNLIPALQVRLDELFHDLIWKLIIWDRSIYIL